MSTAVTLNAYTNKVSKNPHQDKIPVQLVANHSVPYHNQEKKNQTEEPPKQTSKQTKGSSLITRPQVRR